MFRRVLSVSGPLDLRRTLGALDVRAGPRSAVGRAEARRATRTPTGPATVHLTLRGSELIAEAWGSGADWALDRVPELVGLHDDPARFSPPPGLVRELHRRAPGLRLGRTGAVFETLVPTILGQRVTGKEAQAGYRRLEAAYGEPAPGPAGLWLMPKPETIAGLTYHDLHPFGIERKRAVTLIEAARRAKRLEEVVAMSPEDAWKRLSAVRGIGPWSAAIVAGIALGDPDAVPVGDYHIPNTVAWHLAGEPRGSDERMLELLEPFRGQRRRVVLLLKGAGDAPRYGPRSPVRSFERM